MPSGLSSMTGFARVDGAAGARSWIWEMKSVNSRGLETRFRLPPGFDGLELDLRKEIQKKLSRGAVSVNLNLKAEEGQPRYRVNKAALQQAIEEIQNVSARLNCDLPRPDGVLALRGVMELIEPDELQAEIANVAPQLTRSFVACVDALAAARRNEGAAVAKALSALLDEIERLAGDVQRHAGAAPAALRARLSAQIGELLKGEPIPQDRLAQEAAMLAVKADIREELDRLTAHLAAGRELLKTDGPAGRQLDFLSQELNRETNTICAKTQDMEVKRIGLELKKVVDQLREQVQNVE